MADVSKIGINGGESFNLKDESAEASIKAVKNDIDAIQGEMDNAKVGRDGTTYETVGDAIRNQREVDLVTQEDVAQMFAGAYAPAEKIKFVDDEIMNALINSDEDTPNGGETIVVKGQETPVISILEGSEGRYYLKDGDLAKIQNDNGEYVSQMVYVVFDFDSGTLGQAGNPIQKSSSSDYTVYGGISIMNLYENESGNLRTSYGMSVDKVSSYTKLPFMLIEDRNQMPEPGTIGTTEENALWSLLPLYNVSKPPASGSITKNMLAPGVTTPEAGSITEDMLSDSLKYRIQRGSATVTLKANGTTTQWIDFPVKFKVVPTVTAFLEGVTGDNISGVKFRDRVTVTQGHESVSGFDVSVSCLDTPELTTVTVGWIAVV